MRKPLTWRRSRKQINSNTPQQASQLSLLQCGDISAKDPIKRNVLMIQSVGPEGHRVVVECAQHSESCAP
jgi:hypothetical protein